MKPYIWQSSAWPNFTYDVAAFAHSFEHLSLKVGQLSALYKSFSENERTDFLINQVSRETVNSFLIEGEVLDEERFAQSISNWLQKGGPGNSRDKYARVANIMLNAKRADTPMTLARLTDWHAQMFSGDPSIQDIGRPRSGPMTIGEVKNYEITNIYYEAPGAERLETDLQQLLDWIAIPQDASRTSLPWPTPARAAVAHVWFESIHPFSDGNGRIGRALADYVSCQNKIYRQAPLSLSQVIQASKNDYYDALNSVQTMQVGDKDFIDTTGFVEWFSNAMETALDFAIERADFLVLKNTFFAQAGNLLNDRQLKAFQILYKGGRERLSEGLSSRPYQRMTGASSATATRDLNELARKHLLEPTKSGGRSTRYNVPLVFWDPDGSWISRHPQASSDMSKTPESEPDNSSSPDGSESA